MDRVSILDVAPVDGRVPPDVDLALKLAFGTESLPAAEDFDAGVLWNIIGALQLAPRIASRHTTDWLRSALGGELADRLADSRRKAVVTAMMYEAVAADLARAAEGLHVPMIFLKGFALHLSGLAAPGSRPFSDLDVLVPEQAASALCRDLESRGYRASAAPPTDQHLPPLSAPGGGVVDVHFVLREVRFDGGGDGLTVADLSNDDHCRRLDALPGSCLVPRPMLLAAHALAHGLSQHGLRPAGYPLLRMVADLSDLLPNSAAWKRFRDSWFRWVGAAVAVEELEASAGLCLTLGSGRIPEPARGGEEGSYRLLLHAITGSLDPGYGESLLRHQMRRRLAQRRRQGGLLLYLARKVVPGRRELEMRYGPPRSLLGYLPHRLRHPLAQIRRILRSDSQRREADHESSGRR